MTELAERIERGRRAIALAKRQGIDTTEWQRRLKELMVEAGREPDQNEGLEPWMLWEWRRISIPEWRYILKQSIAAGDQRREEYARWMLQEILLDPEYTEDHS
jgi:hypothetical protein